MIEFAVRRLRESVVGSVLDELFSRDGFFVPVPGHAPRLERARHQLWSMRRFCEALSTARFGAGVVPLLERTTAVPAAHLLPAGELRPNARRHFDTIRVVGGLIERPGRLVLVDDVLTRGATMLGCASRLREMFPDVPVSGFCLARARSEPCELQTPISPRLHRVVRWGADDSQVTELGEGIASPSPE